MQSVEQMPQGPTVQPPTRMHRLPHRSGSHKSQAFSLHTSPKPPNPNPLKPQLDSHIRRVQRNIRLRCPLNDGWRGKAPRAMQLEQGTSSDAVTTIHLEQSISIVLHLLSIPIIDLPCPAFSFDTDMPWRASYLNPQPSTLERTSGAVQLPIPLLVLHLSSLVLRRLPVRSTAPNPTPYTSLPHNPNPTPLSPKLPAAPQPHTRAPHTLHTRAQHVMCLVAHTL
jgi:hypothetical protein